jgi:hypothetical protein
MAVIETETYSLCLLIFNVFYVLVHITVHPETMPMMEVTLQFGSFEPVTYKCKQDEVSHRIEARSHAMVEDSQIHRVEARPRAVVQKSNSHCVEARPRAVAQKSNSHRVEARPRAVVQNSNSHCVEARPRAMIQKIKLPLRQG